MSITVESVARPPLPDCGTRPDGLKYCTDTNNPAFEFASSTATGPRDDSPTDSIDPTICYLTAAAGTRGSQFNRHWCDPNTLNRLCQRCHYVCRCVYGGSLHAADNVALKKSLSCSAAVSPSASLQSSCKRSMNVESARCSIARYGVCPRLCGSCQFPHGVRPDRQRSRAYQT